MLIYVMKTGKKAVFNRQNAAQFTQMLSRFESSVMICDKSRIINAKSLLGLLSLGATSNHIIEFTVDGEDEQEALSALKAFFQEEGE